MLFDTLGLTPEGCRHLCIPMWQPLSLFSHMVSRQTTAMHVLGSMHRSQRKCLNSDSCLRQHGHQHTQIQVAAGDAQSSHERLAMSLWTGNHLCLPWQ